MEENVVLLHGFAGTHRAWDGVVAHLECERYRPCALDLRGHGEAAGERPITFAACVQDVLARAPAEFVLCGYSLGGRVALQLALAAPARVRRLVLVSSSPGIADDAERRERSRADRALAEKLETGPFEDFIERWRAQPLFAQDPPRVDRLAREDHRRNSPDGLAAALRGLGTGEMEPLWERLGELGMPVSVIAGERDAKFRELGERMVSRLPAGELQILAGGHALALECPQALAACLAAGAPAEGRPVPTDPRLQRSPTAP